MRTTAVSWSMPWEMGERGASAFGMHRTVWRAEHGGALKNALPMLGDQPFLVVNADVWTDCPFAELREASIGDAHLVLVPNPPYRDDGDFALDGTSIRNEGAPKFTFAGISVYRPRFFDNCPDGSFHITPRLRQAADEERLTGQHFNGRWKEVGTPERLASLRGRGMTAPSTDSTRSRVSGPSSGHATCRAVSRLYRKLPQGRSSGRTGRVDVGIPQ